MSLNRLKICPCKIHIFECREPTYSIMVFTGTCFLVSFESYHCKASSQQFLYSKHLGESKKCFDGLYNGISIFRTVTAKLHTTRFFQAGG